MNKKFLGLAAITMALCLSAFNLREKTAQAQYYWFPLDPTSGFALQSGILVYQAGDPMHCGNFGTTAYCCGAYPSYTGTGPYYAAGIEVIVYHDYPSWWPLTVPPRPVAH